MAVAETIITMAGDTKPALMAASPITRPPTILTACPIVFGRRTPASRSTSKVNSMIRASATAGKGIPSLTEAMLKSSCVGSISW